jgi:hypothetical protein
MAAAASKSPSTAASIPMIMANAFSGACVYSRVVTTILPASRSAADMLEVRCPDPALVVARIE